jgi:hypothetical protein
MSLYLSRSSSPIPSPDYRPKMGPILENALYKAALLYVKAGKYGKAIARYRFEVLYIFTWKMVTVILEVIDFANYIIYLNKTIFKFLTVKFSAGFILYLEDNETKLVYRSMLFAEETESTKEIRRNVCCKLAETLLYGCSEGKYTKPGKLSYFVDFNPNKNNTASLN